MHVCIFFSQYNPPAQRRWTEQPPPHYMSWCSKNGHDGSKKFCLFLKEWKGWRIYIDWHLPLWETSMQYPLSGLTIEPFMKRIVCLMWYVVCVYVFHPLVSRLEGGTRDKRRERERRAQTYIHSNAHSHTHIQMERQRQRRRYLAILARDQDRSG